MSRSVISGEPRWRPCAGKKARFADDRLAMRPGNSSHVRQRGDCPPAAGRRSPCGPPRSRPWGGVWRGAALAVCGLGMAAAARAHPLSPALLELRELGGGRVAVTWKASLLTAPGGEVTP